jgi:hypothetical protein
MTVLMDCIAPPIPEVFHAAMLLGKAAEAHLHGDRDTAARLLCAANIPEVRIWSTPLGINVQRHSIFEVSDIPPIVPKADRYKPRLAPRALQRDLVARDGHHCRFCGVPLIRAEVRKILMAVYPNEVPWEPYDVERQHSAFFPMWLQYDHVVVHSRGGETTMENVVVACGVCNFARDRFMLQEVGVSDPRVHIRLPTWDGRMEWDGLERLLHQSKRFSQDGHSSLRPITGLIASGNTKTMVLGEAVSVALPLTISIHATLPDDIRLTGIMLPMDGGCQAADDVIATDLPKGGGQSMLTIDRLHDAGRLTLHLIATRNGQSVPIEDAGQIQLEIVVPGTTLRADLSRSPHMVAIATEVYERNGEARLRLVDQGHARSWDEHAETITCAFTLQEILAATLQEYENAPLPENAPIVEQRIAAVEPDESGEVVISTQASNDDPVPRAPALPDDALPRMPCDLIYFSQKDGTSRRLVIVVALKNGSMWARALDGRQVKQFKIDGVRELIDAETGEDRLPALLLAS